MHAVVFFALVAAVFAQTPKKPVISDSFEARVNVQFSNHDGKPLVGDGVWVSAYQKNMAVEDYHLHNGPFPLYAFNLQRFDLGSVYEIDNRDRHECRQRVVTGHIPSAWGFLSNASYIGRDIFHGDSVDLWDATVGGVNFRLGVRDTESWRPIFLERRSPGFINSVEFVVFANNSSPDPKFFAIPTECQGAKAVQLGKL